MHRTGTSNSDTITSLERATLAQPDAPTLAKWLDLARGTLDFPHFYVWARQQRKLAYLTVDVTPVCDLVCEGMCYYHPGIDLRTRAVADDVLLQCIRDAESRLGLETLVVAGKEPFLNPRRLFAIMRAIGPATERRFTAGTITNGRHLDRYWPELQDISESGSLDFLDVSLDSGVPSEHDQIRGRTGTFSLAFNSLREAAKRLSNTRVGVSSVLRPENAAGLLELVENACGFTSYFFITPIQPPPYSTIRPLTSDEVVTFLVRLQDTIAALHSERPLEITVLLPGLYVEGAVSAGLFDLASVNESDDGTIYAYTNHGGHKILYSLSVLPEQPWRVARITSDGAYLGHLHFMQTPRPADHAAGYVQKESILTLHERSMDVGTPFHRIACARSDHQCQARSCWTTCFGGWTVAENSLLTGDSLDRQPRLCPKE